MGDPNGRGGKMGKRRRKMKTNASSISLPYYCVSLVKDAISSSINDMKTHPMNSDSYV